MAENASIKKKNIHTWLKNLYVINSVRAPIIVGLHGLQVLREDKRSLLNAHRSGQPTKAITLVLLQRADELVRNNQQIKTSLQSSSQYPRDV